MRILVLTLTFFLSINIWAGEVTGAGMVRDLLAKQNLNLDSYLSSGHELLMGEVTGAGKEVMLTDVKIIIANQEVYKMQELQHIGFKGQDSLDLSAVSYLEIAGQMIDSKHIEAIIISK